MGTTVAATLLAPMALGWLIDHLAGTLPIFVLVGLLVGVVSAARYVYVEVRRIFGSGHD